MNGWKLSYWSKMTSQIIVKYYRKTTENCYFWGSARFYFNLEEN